MSKGQATGGNGRLTWRKSSYSGSGGGDCIEVAETLGTILVRDSKDKRGPKLFLAREAWVAFLPYVGGASAR
ncbi:DUF397 domain-containing protein [Streptomyces rubradiris]|nr:DUF397 domain-containing protein [Streptomyces rubradiris]